MNKDPDVFKWLLSLSPSDLHAFITIGNTQRAFTAKNWAEIGDFSTVFNSRQPAHFLLSRPACPDSPTSRLVAGAGFSGGQWEIFSPSLISYLLQTEPGTFQALSPDPNLRPANLRELFADNPPPSSMTEMPSDAPITHELYQPARMAQFPIAQDSDPKAQSLLAVFKWLYQLKPQHLRVEAGLEDHRATFTSNNWNSVPSFAADAQESFDGTIILYLHPPGTELPTVSGLQLTDKEWSIIRSNYLKHFIPPDAKVTFASVLDIYPDCPVPSTNQFPE